MGGVYRYHKTLANNASKAETIRARRVFRAMGAKCKIWTVADLGNPATWRSVFVRGGNQE